MSHCFFQSALEELGLLLLLVHGGVCMGLLHGVPGTCGCLFPGRARPPNNTEVSWRGLLWGERLPSLAHLHSQTCHVLRGLYSEESCRSSVPEEFIQVEVYLFLSIPREIWLQGRASKPDELFWQVWLVLPARLIFRGFPISLNAEHNCGRILFVCFLKYGDLSCANHCSCSRLGGPNLGWRH